MGFILVAFPIIALVFGSDEPAMQTDNAALVMTEMIFVGIIMMAGSSKRRSTASTTRPAAIATSLQTQRRDVRAATIQPTVS